MSISVVIPTYNRARLVSASIETALAQTRPPDEIIVVDDGSTDDTAAVVAKYREKVIYHRQANGGVGKARNTGLAMAKGDYIALLDSDDLWHPRKLELQAAILDTLPDVHLSYSEFNILKDDGSTISHGLRGWSGGHVDVSQYARAASCAELGVVVPDVPPGTPVYIGDVYRYMVHELLVLTSTSIFRREMVSRGVRFPEGILLYEDWEFFARLARRHPVAYLDFETTTNRGHSGTERLTHLSRLGKVQQYLGLLDRVWKADSEFVSVAEQRAELRRVETRALLVLAREAVLASRPDVAKRALERWREMGARGDAARAMGYWACASLPGGNMALRSTMRARSLVRTLLGTHGRYSVNPAA